MSPIDGCGAPQVCVLYGGASSEREVSLLSGACIIEALQKHMKEAQPMLGGVRAVEISGAGEWQVRGQRLSPGRALEELAGVDLFFIGLHGTGAEDGSLQGLLQVHGKLHTGSSTGASAAAMNKDFTRHIVSQTRIQTARGVLFRAGEDLESGLESLASWQASGWVIKPCSEGSSIGVSIQHEFSGVARAVEASFQHDSRVLVEEEIQGIEVAVGVLERAPKQPQALPVVEICTKPGRFFDYEEKYSATGAEEFCPPKHIDQSTCLQLQDLAVRAHEALQCSSYSRSDFIVPPVGPPVFLEINTLPGLSPRSLLPLAAKTAGLSFEELCLQIVRNALPAR